MNVTEAYIWDFPWFSVPATEFSTNPVTVLVMTVGFNEGIDDSAAGAIAGGDEDILAVGEIEAGKRDEATKVVKAIGVKLAIGLSILFSDLVDELKIDKILVEVI